MERAQICLQRRGNPYSDRLRAYKVVIDSKPVGRIRHGESTTYEVEPGRHVIQLRLDWARSEPRTVNVDPGDVVVLECRPRNPFGALYWITFGRNRYVRLDLLPDPSAPG